ncbi:MAG: FkbM family methyltransferase [Pseudomonadota bacterium]
MRRLSPDARRALAKELERHHLPDILKGLTAAGVSIGTVYDIGAHKGEWTRKLLKTLPQAKSFMFEANESNRPHLEKRGQWFRIGVLSDTSRDVAFFSEGGTGDSYFVETSGHYQNVEPETRRAEPLDKIMRDEGLPPPDFIKLDTQGSELDILAGASDALNTARIVLMECPITCYNKGAPTLAEYVSTMSSKGYAPARAVELHDTSGALLQMDIIFLRKDVLSAFSPQIDISGLNLG